MNNLPEIDLNKRIPLQYAWLDFSDLANFETNYREQYYALKFGNKAETNVEIDDREWRRDKLKHSLQQQFTGLIRDGYFIAYGCYLGPGEPSSEHTEINKAFFDALAPDFEIDYDGNKLHAFGKNYIDIEVLPNVAKIASERPEKFVKQASETAVEPETDLPEESASAPGEEPISSLDNFPQPAGAKSKEDLRQRVIAECVHRFPDFLKWTNKKQIQKANSVARELHPEQFDGRGIARTAYIKSRKIYRLKTE